MTKEAMSTVRVHGARCHEAGVMFVFVALLACGVGEVVAKKARHPEPQALSGQDIEALLPPALLGEWSALLGDGIPGTAVRDDEMLVAWVRPYYGTIEVRLIRDGALQLSTAFRASGACGTPIVEALSSGWFVGWAATGQSLHARALDGQLTLLSPVDLGRGTCLVSVAVGQTVHLVTFEQAVGPAVWTIAVDSRLGIKVRAFAFPDVPPWIPLVPELASSPAGLRVGTSLHGGGSSNAADWPGLSIFATEPCEVVDGPNVRLSWELPDPDAGAISLELDEAGVVSGFDLLPGLPRSCGESRGPRSSGR